MSTTYHAAAILGCRIDESKIFFKKEIRTCDHPLSDNNPKFCSECGKSVFLMVDTAIDEYDYSDQTLSGLRVFGNYVSDQVIIAVDSSIVDSEEWISTRIDPDHTIGSHSYLKEVLEPLGLWDEKQFGIWCMMWAN